MSDSGGSAEPDSEPVSEPEPEPITFDPNLIEGDVLTRGLDPEGIKYFNKD